MSAPLQYLPITLERDVFCRTLLRQLLGTLEEVVGLDEPLGLISVAGGHVGEMIGRK